MYSPLTPLILQEEDLAMKKGDVLVVTEVDEDATWYTGYAIGPEDSLGSFPVNRTRLEGEESAGEEKDDDGEEEEEEEEEEDEEEENKEEEEEK